MTRYVLTVWREHHLPSGFQHALGAFDAISVKVMDGDNVYHPRAAHRLHSVAERYDLARHGWGYHYLRTIEDAEREGRAAGRTATELGLEVYWMDPEKHWAGVAGEPRTLNPPATALAFIEAFRGEAPGCALIWNGFSWPRSSRATGSRPLCTDRVLDAVDGFAPQLYGTRPRTIHRKWKGRAKRVAEGKLWAPMVGTGRIDRRGRVWGFHDDLAGLVTATSPDLVAFYFGSGSASMLLEGNRRNRPVAAVVRELKEQARRRVA